MEGCKYALYSDRELGYYYLYDSDGYFMNCVGVTLDEALYRAIDYIEESVTSRCFVTFSTRNYFGAEIEKFLGSFGRDCKCWKLYSTFAYNQEPCLLGSYTTRKGAVRACSASSESFEKYLIFDSQTGMMYEYVGVSGRMKCLSVHHYLDTVDLTERVPFLMEIEEGVYI